MGHTHDHEKIIVAHSPKKEDYNIVNNYLYDWNIKENINNNPNNLSNFSYYFPFKVNLPTLNASNIFIVYSVLLGTLLTASLCFNIGIYFAYKTLELRLQ